MSDESAFARGENMVVKTSNLRDFPVCVLRGIRADIDYHRHAYYEFVYVCEGTVDHVLNGEHRILSEGNYFLLSPDDIHTYLSINSDPFRIVNFMFNPALIDSGFDLGTPFKAIIKHPSIGVSNKRLIASPLSTQFLDDDRSLRTMFLNAINEYKFKKPGYISVLRATAISGIIACLRNVYMSGDGIEKNTFVTSIIKYVNENYADNVSLSSICDEMGYNVQYVSRSFKAQMGMTFSEYLFKVRIQKACSLLLSTDMTIQEISNAVGYSNTAFFHKVFKNLIGETPAYFRKK